VTGGRGKRAFLLGLCALCVLLFTALGVWQVERRAWKIALIERVNQRVHAPPRPAPGPAAWAALSRDSVEYRRVRVRGTYLHDKETLVQALTELGAGYWVVTPLRTEWGVVLVNRGFVPPERKVPRTRGDKLSAEPVLVTGLLRMTEPGGAFLRGNAPADNRWYSRDVAAIAAARGLKHVAPYFIDAEAGDVRDGWPWGGLTVVSFRNAHLQYAITWFGLALLSAAGAVIVVRRR